MNNHSLSRLATVLATLLLLSACDQDTVKQSNYTLEPLVLTGWQYPTVMRGTHIGISGTGFLPPELGHHTLQIETNGSTLSVPLVWIGPKQLEYVVDDQLLNMLPADASTHDTVFTVRRILDETNKVDTFSFADTLTVVSNLTPEITQIITPDGVMYPGDTITLKGDGFLTQGEGSSVVILKGTFETISPPETRVVQPVLPLTGTNRNTIEFTLTPDVFGLLPGTFKGQIQISNETESSTIVGSALDGVVRQLLPPRIDSVSPAVIGRGQLLTAQGRGFLATDPFYETTTLIRAEGEFTFSKTSESRLLAGPTALALFPDQFYSNERMDYVVRVSMTPSGEVEGLGLMVGGFTGTVSPMLISGDQTILGQGTSASLVIAPQRQVIFVKFLPGFSATLEEMGLGVVEEQIKARILAVCERDYDGVNIEFRDTRPTDYAEYSVVEVGGEDPNQAGLFGLDNTAGKDVGNLRFNDVIGGSNAESREDGYYAFGGVFVRSFFQLSPTLYGADALPIASPRFDQIFGLFMPAMNGKPIDYTDFAGPLQPWIDAAIWTLGNLVGSTVSHEIGHSLGLAAYNGQFHNPGDEPNALMDAGNFRPFQERATIDGYGPARFNKKNREYLERILPID